MMKKGELFGKLGLIARGKLPDVNWGMGALFSAYKNATILFLTISQQVILN
jgi:hypothetical protein